ncbi:M48 family metallopeptidase [Flavobacteriales bacterium]|nr:M48 family metallopeptidase [Flavobacteriales bacterium]
MGKIVLQFFLMSMGFFGTWFALSQIPFVTDEQLQEMTDSNEGRLGDLMMEMISKTETKVKSDSAAWIVHYANKRLCEANGVNPKRIKVHVVYNSEVNAFALPDSNLVVYTGLIAYCKNADELAGVMGHELGHIMEGHVMKKLVKEVGLAMLGVLVGGNSGSEVMLEVFKTLTSTSFDRSQEREADNMAVEYMVNAELDPEHLANFLFRLSQEDESLPDYMEWVSTHPDSKERSADILKVKNEMEFDSLHSLTTPEDWDRMKNTLNLNYL